MKQIILVVLTWFFSSLAKAEDVKQVVRGTCPAETKTIYLYYNANTQSAADSIEVKNGEFQKTLNIEKNTLVRLRSGVYNMSLFADGVPVTLDMEQCAEQGSELNKQLGDYTYQTCIESRKFNALYREYVSYYHEEGSSEADKAKMAELEPQLQAIADRIDSVERVIFDANRTNLIGAAYLPSLMYDLDYDELSAILTPDNELTRHPLAEPAKRMLAQLAKRAPGQPYTDLTLQDVNGQPHQLSEWVGKGNYVMLDCWASWCAPCCAEMPNVVANYTKYHPLGFEVIGLSFDSKTDAWQKAISDLGLNWIHLSDLKGWKTIVADTYGINSIPASILIDPQGKIVAVDLRGDKLGVKLQEIYGK